MARWGLVAAHGVTTHGYARIADGIGAWLISSDPVRRPKFPSVQLSLAGTVA